MVRIDSRNSLAAIDLVPIYLAAIHLLSGIYLAAIHLLSGIYLANLSKKPS
jgi:hypothetical protein